MQTSELTPERLRALAETRAERGLVVSVYLNLDPSEFATPQARETAVSSLIDQAESDVDPDALEHDEQGALREDLERIRDFLRNELPADGAHGVAVFASTPAGLWETVRLSRPVAMSATVDSRPQIEPLAELADATRWAVLLVNRRTARVLRGSRDALWEVARREDAVHGQHQQGGWSQARYERSVEEDVRDHLKQTAEDLFRSHQRARLDRIIVGGPEELVPQVEEHLHAELRERLAGRIAVDVEHSSPDDVLQAAQTVFDEHDRAHEAALLDRARAGVGSGGRGAAGWAGVLDALNEQRVEALLLGPGGGGPGGICPQCGWLGTDRDTCPVDGTALGRRDDISEAAIEAALRQSAEVVRLRFAELGALGAVAAVLRF